VTETVDPGRVVEALRNVPLFSHLSDKQLKLVAQQAKSVSFPPGTEVCKQGDKGVGMHVVLDGETRVEVDGQERRRMGPGAFFGEIALLDGGPRSATVVAETDVHTVSIPVWNFQTMLKANPEMTLELLKGVAQRLRENDETAQA
jgi:CRP/FNR family transcriptional regulator, cyclic AMP receptor protein